MEAGIISETDALGLKQAYLVFRGALHEASLSGRKGTVDVSMFTADRQLVQDCWRRLMVPA